MSTSSFSLTAGSFETYTVNISNASSGLRIKIAASKAEERFFFDEFYAYREEGSEGGGGQEGGGGEATGTADPAISFSASSCVAYVGSPTTYPTFNNPNNLTGISFASSNGSVATVDAETGAVALTGTAGTSTISATFGGNTTYKASTVSYTLNVVNVNSQTFLYKKVTDAKDLQEGGSYVLVCEAQGKVCKSVSSKGQSAAAYIADGIASQGEFVPLCFILESASSYWRLKTAERKYLNTASSSLTDLTLGDATDYSKWSISFDKDGNVSMKNYKSKGRAISYSTEYSVYGNYTETGTSYYNSIQLYQKVYNINIPEVTQGYSTLYNADAAYIMPTGLKGLMVTNAARAGYITTVEAYTEGYVVPAQTALLLNGTAGKYYAPVTKNAGTATSNQNWLHGTRTAENYTNVEGGDVYYYKLAVDENNTPGFYWGAENGAAFLLTKPSTAYLAVPKSVGNASALLFDLNTQIQDVNNGQVATSPAVYDLCGRRVAQPAKGFYIAGGRKVILK